MTTIENQKTDMRKTAFDIGLTFSRQFLAGIMQISIILIIAKNLGAEGVGLYSVALLLPTTMSQLTNCGLASANVYFIASKQFSLNDAWIASRDFILLICTVGLAFGIFIIVMTGIQAFPGVPRSVLFLALLIYPFSLMVGVIATLFQAVQDFRAFNISVLVQPAAALIGSAMLWVSDNAELTNFLAVAVVAHIIAFGIALTLLRRFTSIFGSGHTRMIYLRHALGYGIKAHLGNILSFLNYRIDLFLVNFFVGPAAAGIYSISVRLTEQLWLVSTAFSTVIFPRLSAMVSDEKARGDFTALMTRSVIGVTVLAAVVLAMIAKPLITLLFGTNFHAAVPVIFVLLPGIVIFSGARVLANDLAARGMVGVNLILALVVVIINVAGNLILIPGFGIMGAATSTTLSYILSFVIRLFLHRKLSCTPWYSVILPSRKDLGNLSTIFKKAK